MYAYTRICANTHALSGNVLLNSKKTLSKLMPSSFQAVSLLAQTDSLPV